MKSSDIPAPVATVLMLLGFNSAWKFTRFDAKAVERVWGCDSAAECIADSTGYFGSDSGLDAALDPIAVAAVEASLDSTSVSTVAPIPDSSVDPIYGAISESTCGSAGCGGYDSAGDSGGNSTCEYTKESIVDTTDEGASEYASEYTLNSIVDSALDCVGDAATKFASGSQDSLGSYDSCDAAGSGVGCSADCGEDCTLDSTDDYFADSEARSVVDATDGSIADSPSDCTDSTPASSVDFTTDDCACDFTSDSIVESIPDSISDSIADGTTEFTSVDPTTTTILLPQLLFTLLLPNPPPIPTVYDISHLSTYWCPRPTTSPWPHSSWVPYSSGVANSANSAWYVPEQECGEMEVEMEIDGRMGMGMGMRGGDEGYGSEMNEPRSRCWEGCDGEEYDGETCDAQNYNPKQAYDPGTATPHHGHPVYAIEQVWYPSSPVDDHPTYLQPVGVELYEGLPDGITTAPIPIANESNKNKNNNTRPRQRRECHVDNIETITDQLLRFGQPAMELLDILDVFDEIGVLEGDVFEAEIEGWRGKWGRELAKIAEEEKVEDLEIALEVVGQEIGEMEMVSEDIVTPTTMMLPKTHKTPKKMLTFKRGAGSSGKETFENVLVPAVEKIVQQQEVKESEIRVMKMMSWAAVARGT
ncbi:hypothetical protein EX30DRAFT_66398 [Ascodesmis nigricans]|uniref:Uncharacterized protein n=1 Tax=Ascodesmis nigricans TaxID=341454 RepID=A0A4S2MTX4_9PEZI|nr:hypothetical protein EX30DRAFT_66398 [Ascodesmis nigricans]